ncbi:hypothetical protein SLA2020_433030 [Shorea laevis]
MGFVHFGDIHDKKPDIQDFEDCPLHPDNDTVLSFFKRPKEYGSCLIAVPSASSSVKATIFPNCFGNLSIFMQSNKLRVSKDSKLEMLSGRFFKFSHPCKSIKQVFQMSNRRHVPQPSLCNLQVSVSPNVGVVRSLVIG